MVIILISENKYLLLILDWINLSEPNNNLSSIGNKKVLNMIESNIELIKSKSGFGCVVISVYDKKVSNIKATITTDIITKNKSS